MGQPQRVPHLVVDRVGAVGVDVRAVGHRAPNPPGVVDQHPAGGPVETRRLQRNVPPAQVGRADRHLAGQRDPEAGVTGIHPLQRHPSPADPGPRIGQRRIDRRRERLIVLRRLQAVLHLDRVRVRLTPGPPDRGAARHGVPGSRAGRDEIRPRRQRTGTDDRRARSSGSAGQHRLGGRGRGHGSRRRVADRRLTDDDRRSPRGRIRR